MTAFDPSQSFIWGANGSQLTPAQAEAQRKVAQALMTNGMDYSPVKSAWQGAARMAQAALGGFESGQADASDKATAAMQPKLLADAIAASQGGSPAAPVVGGPSGPGDAATPPMGATAIPAGTIDPTLKDAINNVATARGVDPEYMTRLAMVENGGKVNGGSTLSSAQGPFQFLKGTAQQYGLADPNNPTDSADAAARFTLDNKAALTQALGREPTPGELYLAHQQGATGAAKLLANPDAPVESVIGAQAARNNGAAPGMTAGQFANKWTGRFADIGAPQTVDANSPSPLDNAQYPAGPVGAPTATAQAGSPAVADEGEADTPVNAQPAQGALPTAQAVQAATQPQSAIAKIAPLISAMNNPYASDATKKVATVLLTSALSQENKAPVSVAKGSTLINPRTGQVVYKAPDEEDKPKFGVVGEDNMGRKQYGWINASKQTATPLSPAQGQPQASELDPNVHGEEFMGALQQADPAIASQVRAIVEGRAAYPTGMLLKTPYGQRLAQMVTQADPSFETGNATARVKVRNEFKAGGVASPAGQISAGNTALQHAGEMSDALERMKEDGGILPSIGSAGIPFVSHIANQLHNKAVQGTPSGAALNDFMTAKNHFSEEVTKFYAGSAGSEAERARALANLDAAKSLPELRSAIKTEANLMQGKVNALQERWRNGMGPLVKDFPLISKESQDAIDRVMKRAESSNAPPQAAPAVKEGATIVNPQTGERRIMQGGKWVPVT